MCHRTERIGDIISTRLASLGARHDFASLGAADRVHEQGVIASMIFFRAGGGSRLATPPTTRHHHHRPVIVNTFNPPLGGAQPSCSFGESLANKVHLRQVSDRGIRTGPEGTRMPQTATPIRPPWWPRTRRGRQPPGMDVKRACGGGSGRGTTIPDLRYNSAKALTHTHTPLAQ